jgi:DNA-binding MarR family transcriptional regulator
VRLTAAGATLLDAARPIVEGFQPDILAGLSDEERTCFLDLLGRITHTGAPQG